MKTYTMTAAQAYDFLENDITFHQCEIKSFQDFSEHEERIEDQMNSAENAVFISNQYGTEDNPFFGTWANRTVKSWYNKFFAKHLSYAVIYSSGDTLEVMAYKTRAAAKVGARESDSEVVVMSDYCDYSD